MDARWDPVRTLGSVRVCMIIIASLASHNHHHTGQSQQNLTRFFLSFILGDWILFLLKN